MTTRPRRIIAVVAVATAVALTLSGCVSWFLPPTASMTSTPTNEEVAADLKPFYRQVLTWTECESSLGLQCATAKAPMDWANPAAASIDLALVRHVASSANRLGSLLVNPGGPGGSGYDFIYDSLDYATDARLQANYDIVGFDPRGVNRSSAVSCYSDPAEMDAYIYDLFPDPVGSDGWVNSLFETNRAFGQRCLEETGALLEFVDTTSAARDLDLLRAILGDEKLNYLGYSYGTLLGATYADLYPEKTGRLVLDGAVDPATSLFDVNVTQAKGFESAMHAFLADCIGTKDCPFSGTVEESMTTIRAILDSLDASPLTNSDGRKLGSSVMFTAIILPLYNRANWLYLNQLFASVMQGDPSVAFSLADSYNVRNPDGTYGDNSTEAFISINCLDYGSNADVEKMRTEAAELASLAPVFGPQMGYGDTQCANWPFPPKRDRVAIHAAGSADILVVGTTNDPATPYVWAQNLANELENGHLVTYDGEGHTAYNKSNACVNDTIDEYFISGKVPASDPKC